MEKKERENIVKNGSKISAHTLFFLRLVSMRNRLRVNQFEYVAIILVKATAAHRSDHDASSGMHAG